MNHSKRTTRNMLQSINVYDIIPSQDNLFNSQLSSFSAGNLMGSQQSGKYSIFEASSNAMKKSKDRTSKHAIKLKRTDSYD